MSTLYTSPRLRDWQLPMVRLACDQCGRKGQCRRERLLAEYDPEIPMPDLRHLQITDSFRSPNQGIVPLCDEDLLHASPK
jgi:hypothetical protein